MLTLYGTAFSRAIRVLWMLEETGAVYRHVPVDWRSAEGQPQEFKDLRLGPKIPVLRDGDLLLTESLAINLHLARTHAPSLYPIRHESQVWQWTLFAATELERLLIQLGFHTVVLPPERRDSAAAAAARHDLGGPLGRLEQALAGRPGGLVEGTFSVADVNVASLFYTTWWGGERFTGHPVVAAWLQSCLNRPAARRAKAIRDAGA